MNFYNKGAYVIIGLFSLFSCKEPEQQQVDYNGKIETLYKSYLDSSIVSLDGILNFKDSTKRASSFINSRKFFKRAEPLLAFLESENYKTLNGPNILKAYEEDATDIKVKKPRGFQVVEEVLFADSLAIDELKVHVGFVKNRLLFLKNNTNLSSFKNYHYVWVIKGAIARVLTGVTGLDSPVLENSLDEAVEVYHGIHEMLEVFKLQFDDKELFEEWVEMLELTATALKSQDFNHFDRYKFIKEYIHPQLILVNRLGMDWDVEYPFELAMHNDVGSLFSDSTFNMDYFSGNRMTGDSGRVLLGKTLFNDKHLSLDNNMSCATCHQKSLAFTDGLKKPEGQDRNSPTLLYAALQQKFFYDGRSGSLEGQIVSVVNNTSEFHSNLDSLVMRVKQDSSYVASFEKLYKGGVTDANVRNAMADYIRDLAPFNSKFDRNINGQESNLTDSEISGFNLFSGKAKCATCHFAPVFNGTIPPEFKDTELELIGVPAEVDTIDATIDSDFGRYNLFKTDERKFFFKTPTVRNVELTAPYMHNGVFETLEQVVDFYNRGGGAGIGIEEDLQTLPPDPLNLTEQEQKDIVAFMKTLTDN